MRIFCVGRNYIKHAKELGNAVPDSAVIFMKPNTSLVYINKHNDEVLIPNDTYGSVHQETEVVLVIGKNGRPKSNVEAYEFVSGVGLGLDLTLRDVQTNLKQKGLPWEKSKAFDNSAVLGNVVPYDNKSKKIDLDNLSFGCHINKEKKQSGNTKDMLFNIGDILLEISKYWSLKEGDLIYTGTPEGVCKINPGDKIKLSGDIFLDTTFFII